MRSFRVTPWLLALTVVLAPVSAAGFEEEEIKVKITVLTILATSENQNVDADLKDIAERVQKQQPKNEPKLTGFRQGRQSIKTLTVGGNAESFMLVEEQAVTVKAEAIMEKEKIKLTIKPPGVGEITYTTCCEKFLPIVTRHVTKDKERLIIAIMVENCKK